MKKKIYEIIEPSNDNYSASYVYDISMMVMIVASIIPLAFKETTTLFSVIDTVTVTVFLLDFLLRLCTANYKLPKHGKLAYLIYPFTPMALIDLFCILPSLTALNNGWRLLKVFRLLRTFRVFRVFKMFRYSKSVVRIMNVLRKQKSALLAVCTLAMGYIFISALVVFNVEPDTFDSFFDAVYWATVSLTTVGYGDIYPVTIVGQMVTMLSAVLGIAIVALPAGIITAGYMNELREQKDDDQL